MKHLLFLVGYCLLSLPLVAQTGTPSDPFTSLDDALSVTTQGVYHFDLSGQTFSTVVDEDGYVMVLIEYGSWQLALPQKRDLVITNTGILPPNVLATLTAAKELRMSSSTHTLDAVTPNSTMIHRLVSNTVLYNGKQDNAHNNDWVGTGAQYLTADAGLNQQLRPLHHEVYHVYDATGQGGMHWYPKRGDQALIYNQGNPSVPAGEYWMVWVRATRLCSIAIGNVHATPQTCPNVNDGTVSVTASCDNCADGLQYSLDNTTFQTSNQFSSLAPGDYTVYVKPVNDAMGCANSTTVTVAPGVDTTPPATQPLPTRVLNASQTPQRVPAPRAPDNCAGPVTATTPDPVWYTTTGEYTIHWTFDDGNGNVATQTEQITVYGPILKLPIVETVEDGGPTRSSWRVMDFRGDGGWVVSNPTSIAYEGTKVFYLPPNSASGQYDQLRSPGFAATTSTVYDLSFAYRPVNSGYAEQLQVFLIDLRDNTLAKTLLKDVESGQTYREIKLSFDVPTDGNYRIIFQSQTTSAGSKGLILDDIRIAENAGLPGGASDLGGNHDGACTTTVGYGMHGEATTRFVDASGRLLLEVNPNGNDLGDVTIEMTDYSQSPLSPQTGQFHLSRHFNIRPSNGSGPYAANGGVKVRLFFTDAELTELNQATGGNHGWAGLALTHYSGPNEDCDIFNSTGGETFFEDTEAIAAFGGTAHALSFTTTSFSEFGATNSVVLPVDLRAFTATAQGDFNRLDWQVDSEIDFSHYAVERSTDGLRFTELARVGGNQQAHYSWIDPAPAALQYYRLKLEDYDGSHEYTDVVSVKRAPEEVWEAFPVPTTDRVTLRFSASEGAGLQLHVTDAFGRAVLRQSLTAHRGTNAHVIDLQHLPPGHYQATLRGEHTHRTARLVKR